MTLPLTLPGLAAGVVLVFVPSLGQFVVSDLLGGARSMLLGNLIQNQFAVARNKPFGSALAFELMAAVLVLLLAYAVYAKKTGRGGAAVKTVLWPRRLLAHTALVYLFLYAPIAILVVFSFNASRQTAFWSGFTLDWYRQLFANPTAVPGGPQQPGGGRGDHRPRRPAGHAARPWRWRGTSSAASGPPRRCSTCR